MRIMLSIGPLYLDEDTVVIDHRHHCIWRGEKVFAVGYSPYHIRFRFMTLLLTRISKVVTHEEIVDFLWSDHPDGGPLTIYKTLNVHVYHCRPKFRQLGMTLHTHWAWGLELREDH